MRLLIGDVEIAALQKLREADAPIRHEDIGFAVEVLGLVEGSYQGHKGLGTGGGKNRHYVMTEQGFAFMARIDWLKQRR